MKHEGPNLAKAEWRVLTCTMRQLHEMIGREHYAQRGSNTATFRHGLYRLSDFRCMGVAWWIPPTKSAAMASWPEGDWRQVLALHRLACVPEAPRNSESFLIARSVDLIRLHGFYRCLVTYADTQQGHSGQIYKATNWEELGETNPESTFVDHEGTRQSRKRGPHTLTQQEMTDAGYEKIGVFARIKFRKILPPYRVGTATGKQSELNLISIPAEDIPWPENPG